MNCIIQNFQKTFIRLEKIHPSPLFAPVSQYLPFTSKARETSKTASSNTIGVPVGAITTPTPISTDSLQLLFPKILHLQKANMAEGVTIFNVISVISAAIGFVGFMQSNLPSNVIGPMDSSVRIAVALNGDKGVPGALRHAAGETPIIIAFNENNHYCGSSGQQHHPYITSGSFRDIKVDQSDGPGEQATSLQIIATTNELCIAYIGQTWADGAHRGWTGDMGKACNRDWYYSNIIVGDDHKPSESGTQAQKSQRT